MKTTKKNGWKLGRYVLIIEVILITLKLTNQIYWDWLFVMLPLIIWVSIGVILFLLLGISFYIDRRIKEG